MSKKLTQLAKKRERLVSRAAQQRLALRQDVEPWRIPLAVADQGISAVRYVRRHPRLMVGAVVILAATRPVGAWHWLQRGLIAWQLVKTL